LVDVLKERRPAIELSNASRTFTADDLRILLSRRSPPCVSVYMPTHRRKTEGRSDAILYRNLCRNVEKLIERDAPGSAGREILALLRSLDREDFWEDGGASDGLSVFASQGFLSCYRLPAQFPELEVVGASFHTKPLMRFLQSNSLTYNLLALNLHRVALYEGLGDSIHEVPLRGVPLSLEEVSRWPSPVEEPPVRPASGDRLHYGQGGAKEQTKTDLEKFFRAVGRELWRNHLRSSSKGLILAAPAQHQSTFRRVAQVPTLLDAGIAADPAKMSPDELKAEARRILEPEIQRRIAAARDEFGLAKSRGQGTDDLKEVAKQLVKGRIKLVFVESGRRI
jgi:hypothetical protein